jgi:hypothetical protein
VLLVLLLLLPAAGVEAVLPAVLLVVLGAVVPPVPATAFAPAVVDVDVDDPGACSTLLEVCAPPV